MQNSNHYVLNEEVEAVVVTEAYLGSLPRMGGNPQRVKDTAEIHGPRGEKSYAALDDYVVKVGEDYLAVPKTIFRAMFTQVPDVDQSVATDSTPNDQAPAEDKPVDGETESSVPTQPQLEPSLPDSGESLEKLETEELL